MSIAPRLALHATAKHNPQVLRIACFIPYGPGTMEYLLSSSVKQRTLCQLGNAPTRSENDSRAVFQSPLNSELDDPFIAHREISGLNVNLGLDNLSIPRVEISGLDVDLELESHSAARVEFPGSNIGLELDDLSIACIGTSGSNVDWELYDLSIARVEFSGLNLRLSKHGTVVF